MKMTKIEIITRSNKLDELMEALNDIGVLGMTVSQVFGCGLQKGHEEVYRGKKYDVNLVPKIKLETVVCENLSNFHNLSLVFAVYRNQDGAFQRKL